MFCTLPTGYGKSLCTLVFHTLLVIAKKGQKHVTALVSGNKTQITVLVCASAAGNPIPPMVIFDRINLNQELTIGEVPGTMYGLNPGSGWIDQELFRDWFEQHFLQYAPATRPLLLLNGHSTHYQPEVVRLAASNGVIMFALPPTHNPCCAAPGCHVFSCSQNVLGSGVQQVHG